MLRFVDAIKNQDTSLVFKKDIKDSFMRDLHDGYNEIITDFRLVRKEKELEHHFFQNIIQHLTIGIAASNQTGIIRLQNKAFKNLCGINNVKKIDDLRETHKDLPDLIYSMNHGEESSIKLLANNEFRHLSIKISEIKLEKEPVKIISFQDISREIDRNEVEAWQKLIKVLRHEIMNSISPIRIMSGNLLNMLTQEENSKFDKFRDDMHEGLRTIRKRSEGLSEFVESYRSLSKIPEPRFSEINIKTLLTEVVKLFENNQKDEIAISVEVTPRNLMILGDENMLQQVLINLVKNAMESFDDTKHTDIHIKAFQQNQKKHIQISDKGRGIPEDRLENIFIPFYTTKEKGSGIGLSFSRQIMHLHNGNIQINSEENKGTTVLLTF